MTTNAKIGHGSLFELWDFDISPEGYVVVGEVTSITLPALARDAVDATHTESTDGWREFIPGLKDGGEVAVEMNFVSGSATDSKSNRRSPRLPRDPLSGLGGRAKGRE